MSTTHPTDDECSPDVDTAELPQLTEAVIDVDFDFDLAEEGLTASLPESAEEPGERAAAWINQMQDEIEGLHERWRQVNEDQAQAVERIADLESALAARDASVDEINARLQESIEENLQLESYLSASNEKLESVNARLSEQSALLQRSDEAGNELKDLNDKLQSQLAEKLAENNSLNETVQQQESRITSLERDVGDFDKRTSAIRKEAHELECYIDSRRVHWEEQNTKLAELNNALKEKQKTIKQKDKALAATNKESEALNGQLLESEKQNSLLNGRLLERDEALSKVQNLLQDQVSISERLRSDISRLEQELDAERSAVSSHAEGSTRLQGEIEQRDARIEELQDSLRQAQDRIAELSDENARAASETSQLRETISERESAIQDLTAQVEQTSSAVTEAAGRADELHEQLEATRARETELESGAAALNEEKVRLEAEIERRAAQIEEAEASVKILNSKIETLQNELEAAGRRETDLESVIAGLTNEKGHLEREIAHQQSLIDAFDQGAQALNNLHRDMGASNSTSAANGSELPELEAASAWFRKTSHDPNGSADSECNETIPMLVVSTPGEKPFIHKLTKDSTTIGRASNCDIRFTDSAVSRFHARLIKSETGFEIEDMGSTNGLLVNKERIGRASLQHGDVVNIAGRILLKFL